MPYNDLREFIERLEKEEELVRVRAEVDPDLGARRNILLPKTPDSLYNK